MDISGLLVTQNLLNICGLLDFTFGIIFIIYMILTLTIGGGEKYIDGKHQFIRNNKPIVVFFRHLVLGCLCLISLLLITVGYLEIINNMKWQ